MLARIAIGTSKRVELLEVSCLKSGLGHEMTPGRLFEGFTGVHPSAGQSPQSREWSRFSAGLTGPPVHVNRLEDAVQKLRRSRRWLARPLLDLHPPFSFWIPG